MSDLRVTRIKGRTPGSSPSLPDGAVVTGVTTSGSLKITDATQSTSSTTGAVVISGGVGIAKSLHVGGNVSVGGTLTYEDVTNIDSVGLITARTGIKVNAGGIDVTAGGVDVTAGGVNVTAGGVNVTADGIDIAAGGAKITGNIGLGGANYGTSGQVLTSGGSGANASWTTISSAPVTELVANGSLTANAGVVVNSSGQAESLTGEVAGQGSATAFETGSANRVTSAKISDNKYVICYQDVNNSESGTALIATTSGTTVTYGTSVVFEGDTTTNIAVCRIDDSRFAVMFRTNSANMIECQIGSISGTTITMGTAVNLSMTGTVNDDGFDIGYQQDVNCLLMFAASSSNSHKPYVLTARPSGTTVNLSSAGWHQLENQNNASSLSVVENTTDNELMLAWISQPQQVGGRSCVAKCSGASGNHTVTYGQNEYISNQNQQQSKICYNSVDNKYVYVFKNNDQSGKLSLCCGTPSGTSGTAGRATSWTTYQNFFTGSGSRCDVAYDATAQRYLIVYADASFWGTQILYKQNGNDVTNDGAASHYDTTSNVTNNVHNGVINIAGGKFAIVYPRAQSHGMSIIRQLTTTNLTVGNFIGFADANYTNGQTATIKIVGNTVTGQSGLTPGVKYYVAGDGSLTSTEGEPSVVAGTALSPTKLLIKPQ